jgi:hypothetical protein
MNTSYSNSIIYYYIIIFFNASFIIIYFISLLIIIITFIYYILVIRSFNSSNSYIKLTIILSYNFINIYKILIFLYNL